MSFTLNLQIPANHEAETITIDTTIPQVTISNNSELINEEFYNGSTTFTIVVKERNFSASCMNIDIKNSYTSAIPVVEFVDDNELINCFLFYYVIYFLNLCI